MMSNKMLSFDIQTISDDQKMFSNSSILMESSEDTENNRQVVVHISSFDRLNDKISSFIAVMNEISKLSYTTMKYADFFHNYLNHKKMCESKKHSFFI